MIRRGVWILAFPIATAGYLATGVTVLQPDEVGIVRRFGAVIPAPREPGLHCGLPWGIDRVDRLKLNQIRTLKMGAPGQNAAPFSRAPDPASDDFLTGDLNLVTAEALVQYRVRDPASYLFRARNLEESLSAISESALTRALATRGVDVLLTSGRAEVAASLALAIQSLADQEGLGISIVAIRLGRVVPPAPVAPAFADAARARSDRRQAITRAREYRDRSQSEARGLAREIVDAAAGQVDRLVEPARGEAERFSKVLVEARTAPGPFRQRQYLATLAEILPRLGRTIVVPSGEDLDLTLLGDAAPKAREGAHE
jgi:membrane protease subunit HflK